MKAAYVVSMGIALLLAQVIKTQDDIPVLAKALKPFLTEQEFKYVYEVDNLDTQADRMQELLTMSDDFAKQAALQTAINQTIHLEALLDALTEEEQ